eukprot:TRINITY_DN5179_c0_g1_i1.p1 TRINITY_DN5179_c0_g1~~TRINITY_DN5179_c0_g1_i1.p1  ORF type:complete len:1253 (-),score=298.49 TRINITY_DN5179_c0_g1_i1:61-3783(-)
MSELKSVAHGKEKILLGYSVLDKLPQVIKENVNKVSRYVVITDSNVYLHAGKRVFDIMNSAGLETILKVVPPGEATKCREVKDEIEDWMLKNLCNRDTCVIAVGGGVVGDLAGYVAATYMRGLPFVQVPTTLLAMVDSSIGGKTGIDTPAGKNLVGAFHHPVVVFMDTSLLKTLPKREYINGMAEVIKTAAIWDEKLFLTLERNVDSILSHEHSILNEVIFRCASIKAEVVAMDDKEGGIRSILNFGHTIGHAIEAFMTPKMLHGECVSIGMVLECELSNIMGHLKTSHTTGRINRLCQVYGLPVAFPKSLKPEAVMDKMGIDKKNAGKKIRCTIIKSIGEVFPDPIPVEPLNLRKLLFPYVAVKPPGRELNATITVPGSKSISNRVLLFSSLAKGTCRISGLLHADDTDVMLDALNKLGVQFQWVDDGQVLVVHGSEGKFQVPFKPFYLGNAGTATRFLTTMCFLVNGIVTITGSERLCERPMEDLVEALSANGCKFKFIKQEGCIPFEVHGSGFPGGDIKLSATVSSQFVSSILISAPYAKSVVRLSTNGEEVSRPFIDMTIAMMKQFGVTVEEKEGVYHVPLGVYNNPAEITVESDASSASYPLAMAAITGGQVIVKNVGCNSIQGDAKFYTVLEMMGCTVKQTETETVVKGPSNGLLKAVEVDMDHLTDTFMTITVLAVVAQGVTKITGIANQRVKECNRIAAMVTELSKLGVNASELPDGIQIVGLGGDLSSLKGAVIECYKDHRIAMSFAVLGLRVPGIVISDKECVNKTYPEFWNDLEKIFKVELEIPELQKSSTASAAVSQPEGLNKQTKPSLVIIGMRGSGKTTMGKKVADKLGWKFLDMDDVFAASEGITIKEFIEKGNTWDSFREKEEELLKKTLQENPNNTIISCGGGIVERPTAVEFLRSYSKANSSVLQLSRDINDIVQYLNSDKSRANLGESPESIWNRRKDLYSQVCSKHFHIYNQESWESAENSLFQFIEASVYSAQHPKPLPSSPSYFLCLTYPKIEDAIPFLPHITSNVQAIELRVDLLSNHLSHESVMNEVSLLKRKTNLPIIFTVRTRSQGGSFDCYNIENQKSMFKLLELGVALGCDYIDVEADWDSGLTKEFLSFAKQRGSKIISSYHNFNADVTVDTVANWIQLVKDVGDDSDVLKIVGMAKSVADVSTLSHVISTQKLTTKPIIALLAGEHGKLSRVLNGFMTPVTHPIMSKSAAPGQISLNQIESVRRSLGIKF